MNILKEKLISLLPKDNNIKLSTPPDSKMGDFAFSCFDLAKEKKKNPVEVAKELAGKIKKNDLIDKVEAMGPYVNFYLNPTKLLSTVLSEVSKDNYGSNNLGVGKKIMVEYGCPNPLKVFHLGHLKNLITGDSVARIMKTSGFDVIKANYQGDVGMHVAKTMWVLHNNLPKLKAVEDKDLVERIKFLGSVYVQGAKVFEEDGKEKKEILEMNEKIYNKDKSVQEIYKKTVKWSLDYFELIYKKLDVSFDEYYLESETYRRGLEIVQEGLKKGIFVESEGAIIFEGSKHGLHDRVFINSKGYPTYEAKDLALAESRFKKHPKLDNIIHVVGKEQTEYFKVVFKALAKILPKYGGKSEHLIGGYLQLKGEKKMSSRLGNVIAGDELVDLTESKIKEIMVDRDLKDKDESIRKLIGAVLKYAMLKSNVSQDVSFDMESSISFTGDSGPYLLYIVARIESIMIKVGDGVNYDKNSSYDISEQEKELLLKLAKYPEIVAMSSQELDPSKIAQYLFSLAQSFNRFYDACPILQEKDGLIRGSRVEIIKATKKVMSSGLNLLGIEVVKNM